jgi:hypothetical protein
MQPPRQLVEFLKPFDRAIQDLALAVRTTVLAEFAPCHENIYDACNAVAIGYGPTDRQKDCICHIAVYSKHVNLGFNRGAELDDPHHLLQGTGKNTRHVKLKTPAELASPHIREYLRSAREHSASNLAPPAGVVSVVKAIYPTRRRPKAR